VKPTEAATIPDTRPGSIGRCALPSGQSVPGRHLRGSTVPTAGLILVFGVALVSFVTWVAALIFAFQRSIGQGLLTLLVPFYIIWFVYGVNDNSYLKWAFGGALVGYACQAGWVAMVGFDALDGLQQQMGGF
jgi:hypothetical protein